LGAFLSAAAAPAELPHVTEFEQLPAPILSDLLAQSSIAVGEVGWLDLCCKQACRQTTEAVYASKLEGYKLGFKKSNGQMNGHCSVNALLFDLIGSQLELATSSDQAALRSSQWGRLGTTTWTRDQANVCG
jgi:hypothetical protein